MGILEWGRRLDREAAERIRTGPPPGSPSTRAVRLYLVGLVIVLAGRLALMAKTDSGAVDVLTAVAFIVYLAVAIWAFRRSAKR